METARFDPKTVNELSGIAQRWTPLSDFRWQTYEARIGDFTIAVWKQNNGYTIPIIRKYVENPAFVMEVYKDTGKLLERHRLYRTYGPEVKSLYENIIAAKRRAVTEHIERIKEREPEYLTELEGILNQRDA